jgi:hypothetical protein
MVGPQILIFSQAIAKEEKNWTKKQVDQETNHAILGLKVRACPEPRRGKCNMHQELRILFLCWKGRDGKMIDQEIPVNSGNFYLVL